MILLNRKKKWNIHKQENIGYPITTVSCNPDRHSQIQFVVRYERNQTIKTLDSNLKEIDEWKHPHIRAGSHPTSVIFSSNGKYIATGLIEGTDRNILRVWETNTKKEVDLIVKDTEIIPLVGSSEWGRIKLIDFTSDSKNILSIVVNNKIYLWSIGNKSYQEKQLCLSDMGEIKVLSVSPRGDIFAIGDSKGQIIIYEFTSTAFNPDTPKSKFQAHGTPKEAPVNSLAFNPKRKLLASAGDDCKIKLWDLSKKSQEKTLGEGEHDVPINVITFSPDGKFLASGDDSGYIKIWDMNTYKNEVLKQHQKAVTSLSFTPDGKTLVSGSKDGNIILWEKQN